MKQLQGLLTVAAACVALAAAPTVAHASTQTTWSFSFTGEPEDAFLDVAASGEFVTDGDSTTTPQLLTSITGTYQDVFTPSGAISLVPLGDDTYFTYDNEFGGGSPWISENGILFTVDGSDVNLYQENGVYYVDDHVQGLFDLTVPVDLTVTLVSVITTVPEPATPWLLALGLGALALVGRRRAFLR